MTKMNIKEEYLGIINEFIDATKNGKLIWKKQNPTTVFIETPSNSDKAIIAIQKVVVRGAAKVITQSGRRVMTREHQTNYIFTVKNASTSELVIQIDTNSESSYKDKLKELFDICEYSTEKKNMDFLKGIIQSIR